MIELLEELLSVLIVKLRPLIPDADIAASIMRVLVKFLPHDMLRDALTDEARKRVDDAVDAAEKAKLGD